MKRFIQLSVALLLISLSSGVAAGNLEVMPNIGLSPADIKHCLLVKDYADLTEKYKKIVPKAIMYSTVPTVKGKFTALTAENEYTIIDFVFKGYTPDRVFDDCLDVMRDTNSEAKVGAKQP